MERERKRCADMMVVFCLGLGKTQKSIIIVIIKRRYYIDRLL